MCNGLMFCFCLTSAIFGYFENSIENRNDTVFRFIRQQQWNFNDGHVVNLLYLHTPAPYWYKFYSDFDRKAIMPVIVKRNITPLDHLPYL